MRHSRASRIIRTIWKVLEQNVALLSSMKWWNHIQASREYLNSCTILCHPVPSIASHCHLLQFWSKRLPKPKGSVAQKLAAIHEPHRQQGTETTAIGPVTEAPWNHRCDLQGPRIATFLWTIHLQNGISKFHHCSHWKRDFGTANSAGLRTCKKCN